MDNCYRETEIYAMDLKNGNYIGPTKKLRVYFNGRIRINGVFLESEEIPRLWCPYGGINDKVQGYQLSTMGEVFGKRGLIKCLNEGRYTRLNKQMVHRLMAETFLPSPHGHDGVDHINEVKSDNRICNLRYVSPSLNNNLSSLSKMMPKHTDQEKLRFVYDLIPYEKRKVADIESEINEIMKKHNVILDHNQIKNILQWRDLKQFPIPRRDELMDESFTYKSSIDFLGDAFERFTCKF